MHPAFRTAQFLLRRSEPLPVDLITKLIGLGHDPAAIERKYGV